MPSCELNQIFLGEVASVQNYGAFVRIPGGSQQGLIHRSQISSAHVDDVSDVLQRGERIWCKVISMGDDGKVGLSMKYVNQGNGTDLDPSGIQLQRDEQKRKTIVPNKRKVIELEAVLNTNCTKCGTHGHLSSDCFMPPDGKKYALLPEMEEESTAEPTPAPQVQAIPEEKKKHKAKKSKSKKKSKKSKHKRDSSADSSNSEAEDGRKKRKKKRKRKKKSQNSGSSDAGTNSGSENSHNVKARKRKQTDDGERHSKKCKHSKSKYSD